MHQSYIGIAFMSLLLLGCGESASDIAKSDKVIIVHKLGLTGCVLLENFGKDDLKKTGQVTNIHYSSKNNKVSCQSYGKTKTILGSYNDISSNLDLECAEFLFSDIQEAFPNKDLGFYKNKKKSCVLSFDLK